MNAAPEGDAAAPLAIINHPPRKLPGPGLLHDLVRDCGSSQNAAIEYLSVDGHRSSMTYDELHRLSDSLALKITSLRRNQQQKDDNHFVVPILAPQHPSLYVAQLAILKAGGAFCPLNLDAPAERVKFILKDVSASIVITTSKYASAIPPDASVSVLLLDDEATQGLIPPVSHRLPTPADLAYVMYTSGSTGTPKGVGVSHEAATQSLLAHNRHIPQFSRFLQFAAPTFDVSVFEIFFPLFRGSTLVSCDRARMLDDLPSVIRSMDIDACELTPSVAGSLLRKRENVPYLKLLLTIGEMLTRPVVDEFGGGDGRPSMLWAMYGPTEAAIHCTLHPALPKDANAGNIGFPLDTVSVFILEISDASNENKSPRVLKAGEIGELAVGGYQLASGYINRAETTAQAFVDSPYGLLYRTADKARIWPDGAIECLGRIGGGQVKLRGQRIELGEIEHVALRTPGCHGAMASVIGGILVLFCAVDALDAMVEQIHQTFEAWLPSFMVPGDIIVITDFPRLPSGKVDRRRLISDYSLRQEGQDQDTATKFTDATEQTLCQLAGSVLKREIRPSTNLATAGMDSLLAIRFTSVLRQASFDLSAIDVLSSKSISQLQQVLARSRQNSHRPSTTTTGTKPSLVKNRVMNSIPLLQNLQKLVEEVLPCTPLQSAMLAETASNPQAYCNWMELTVAGNDDSSEISSWFSHLASSNKILRTGFVLHEGAFRQIIWRDSSTIPISFEDHIVRDFTLATEEDFLHPFRVQLCVQESEKTILLQIHHSLYDGWTVDLLLEDIIALSKGRPLQTRPQFREVVEYYQSSSFISDCDTARTFWAENLSGFQPNPFPILRDAPPRLSQVASLVGSLPFRPESTRGRLIDIDCSPQVLFQAALAWLWGSLVGDEDVITGVVTSGRTIPVTGIERIMGPCIASLPLRTDLSQTKTVKDLLGSIQARNRSALAHASLPLAEIKKAAGIPPGQSLYDVLFVYQQSLTSEQVDKDSVREVAHFDYLETKLLVEVEPKENSFEFRLTYHTDAFSDDLIEVLMESLELVTWKLLDNMHSDLTFLRSVFPTRLLSTYNLKPRSFSGVPDLAATVEQMAAGTPDTTALCFAHRISDGLMDAERVSYREFNSIANQIARRIRSSGCATGDVVSIVMEKSILLYAGILGIVKAGCSYLPLLPSTPVSRMEVIHAQANVKLSLTDDSAAEKLSQIPGLAILDLKETDLAGTDDSNLNIPPDPARIAVIVYTSGSTGVPKGVCVTQLNVTSNIDVLSRIYPVQGNSKLLQSCSQAFDVSVFEMFFAWTQGMTLCSATNDTLFEDLELSIRKLEVTHLSMTPTVASLVDPRKVPKVEFLVTSGEPMTEKVARNWWRQLYQGYGPSETTNICTVKKMGHADHIRHLGHSFGNTSTVVLFQDSTDVVPRGCLGELCFGGDQVAQGYLNMPDLTAARFIDHQRYGRLYRSGDLGRMLPDGSLVISGRVDDQIKLRGQRIELNEINATIRDSELVSDCFTTLVNRDGPSTMQLASFYVPLDPADSVGPAILPLDDGLREVTTTLYRLLKANLPSYMVPSYLIPVAKIPVTASGKLDRSWFATTFSGLEQPYLELTASKTQVDKADGDWTETERKVASIVSSVLSIGGSSVSRWTPLISFGLDSISAISLSRQLQNQFNRRFPISVILQNPSVARLAQILGAEEHTQTEDALDLNIFPSEWLDTVKSKCQSEGKVVEKILPCTPLQEAMLAASTNGQSYLNNMLFRLHMDPAAMRSCWTAMCERHGILRTCFATTDAPQHAFAQVVLHGWQPVWLQLDESHGTLDDCIWQHLASHAGAVDTWKPPLSFAIIQQGEQVYLSFVCHHALYDGIAIELLLHEVEHSAKGKTLDAPPPVEPFLKAMLADSPTSDDFWKEQLIGFKPLELPSSKSLFTDGNSHGTHSTQIHIPLSNISEKTKKLGSSLLSVCQAAWALVLASILQTEDVCFGNVVSCRSIDVDGIEHLVAPCFNTVPIRANISDYRQNIDLIKRLGALGPKIMQHQFTSLRRIQSLAFPGAVQRLFDTLLILQQPARSLDSRLWTLERDDGEMDIPLVCEFRPDTQRDVLSVQLHYDCFRISKSFADVVAELLQHCMSVCLNYPSSQVPTQARLPSSIASRLSNFDLQRRPLLGAEPMSTQNGETWSDMESRIRTILAKLSSVPKQKIRRTTTIYQLGLDSINAVQIAALLRKQGLAVSASDVIEQKTCANLAKRISRQEQDIDQQPVYDFTGYARRVEPQLAQHSISIESLDAILPCTPLQAGMIVQSIQSKGRDYFNFVDYQVDSGVTLHGLSHAWAEVARKHPMLRTGFVPTDEADFPFAMVQYLSSNNCAQVSFFDIRIRGNGTIEDWRKRMAHEVFDRLQLPPWRVTIAYGYDDGGVSLHLAIHHALYDAQSLQVVMEDVARVLRGEPLTRHSITTEDVVREIIAQKSQLCNQEAFWKAQSAHVVINHFPSLTPLRIDSRTMVVESMVSAHSFTDIEKSLGASGFTVQAALQAAWTRILSSYLGESSVTFGVVLSGRNTEATQDAVFPCISTVPVISSNKASNGELLQSMLEYSGSTYKSQHVPLNKIQRWLGYPEGKIFDTLLVYQKLAQSSQRHLPWTVTNDTGTVDYPVSIEVEPNTGGSLVYRITAFSDVVPKEHARLLLQQFDAVFCDLALHPDGHEEDVFSRAPDLFAVTAAEDPVLHCEDQFLHQLVESQARKTPDKTALEFVTGFDGPQPVSRSWSYRSLDENGNRVARLLQPHVRTGATVAVLFDKCSEAFSSILGVLKAGCAFVALDPGAPSFRKQFILEDSQAVVLLTSVDLDKTLDFEVDIARIAVDEPSLSKVDGKPFTPSPELTPQHTCYCLYTSGTTGTPKGCEITHENAVQAMLAFQRLFTGHWDETSKWLHFASFHFDVSVLEQYWTWSVGMALVAVPRDLILEDLAGTISRLEITHIDLTPSLARLIHPDEVPSLTRGVFITGGESLKQEILDAWGSTGAIHNFYGPTEATIGVTTFSRVPQNGRPSNIGKQFPNVGTYVFKPGTETPVLRGGVGELCVSGKLVGKGYLGRDELTAEKFPTLKQFHERVYRTGDLVRILHDGCFDFLGRADDQVKLRGQRLELGEIDHAIRTGVPNVVDVATLVVRNEKQRKDVLVSFVGTGKNSSRAQDLQVLGSPDASDMARRVQAACRDKLPGYMVPTYVLVLPFIPLSSNNKAETKKLKQLFVDLDQGQLVSLVRNSDTNSSLSEVEKEVMRVLSSVATISLEDVDLNATIFDFGIDSISVMRLCTALKRAGFSQTSPSLVLKYPRLGDLASQLSRQRSQPSSRSHVLAARQLVQACHHKYMALAEKELGVDAAKIEYIAPCSPLQEGMISRSNMPVSKGAYFNTFKYKLSPSASSLKLRMAWTKLVESCSVLRTRFLSTPEGYVQVAVQGTNFPWTEMCLATEGDLDELVKVKQRLWIESNVHHVKQPLEIMVISIGDQARYMVVNISHGIYDATSLDDMLHQLRTYYLEAPVLNTAPSYLEALVHGPLRSFTDSRDFWVDHLKSASYQPFPAICAQPSNESISSERVVSVGDLETLRTTLGVTHQAILQAVWISVYQQFLADVTIGVVISGRATDLDGADHVIGPLFNTIAFHASLVPGESWASLIRKCHEFNVSIMAFQHVALRDVQKWCSGGRPLFDTLFSFQRAVDEPTAGGNELWTLCESEPNPDYALAFEATLMSDDQVRLQLVAKDGIADVNSLEKILDQLAKALHDVLTPENVIPLASHHGTNAASNGTDFDYIAARGLDSFEWSPTALAIRVEIASLADVSAEIITATTPLLELGLDSIDLIKLSSRLRSKSIAVSSGQLMRGGTISAVVQHLDRESVQPEANTNGTPSIEATSQALKEYLVKTGYDLRDVEDVLPVTPLQDAMVAEMVQSDFQRYFNHDVLELDPAVESNRLLEAWRQVVANSPVLRTTFVQIDSSDFDAAYCQVVNEESSLTLPEVTLGNNSDLPRAMDSARPTAAQAVGRSELLQLTLVTIHKRRFLVLSIAHSLYDGWSLGLLHQDVRAAYYGSYVPRPPYKEYLTNIVNALTPEAKQFWTGYLSGAQATLVPHAKHTGVGKEEVHRHESPSSLPASSIRAFCKKHAVSLHVLTQASWAAVLASRTGALDVSFGVVLSGRETEEAESLLFPTMNTVAVRSILHGGVKSWLRYMQENMAAISSYQHFPLREALKVLGRTGGGLFNSLFIQQRTGGVEGDGNEGPWMKSVGGEAGVEYPVCVEVEMVGEELVWRVACSSEYLTRKETGDLVGDLDSVLRYLVDCPSADVLTFDGERVSVCGLPPFELLGNQHELSNRPAMDDVDDTSLWSGTESQIRLVLSEVSGVPVSDITKGHTVYHLGLDSISTIKVSSLLRKKGITLGVRQILGAQSITEMAAIATRDTLGNSAESNSVSSNGTAERTDDHEDSIATYLESIDAEALLAEAWLDERTVEEVLPATAMQVHMLSVWQNTGGSVFFPEFTYSLPGEIDSDIIGRAWSLMVERFAILRTTFIATASREIPFLQVVHRKRPQPSRLLVERDTLIDETPLVSLRASGSGTEWRLKLKIHHSLYDGVSLPLITESFRRLCESETLPNTAADASNTWKKWIFAQISNTARQSRKEFWTRYLAGAKPLPFPRQTIYPTASSSNCTSLFKPSALKHTDALQSLCSKAGVSLQALFFAAYALHLSSTSTNTATNTSTLDDDVVFGVYLANRTSSLHNNLELDRLPYPTLSLVPLRVRRPAGGWGREQGLGEVLVEIAKAIQKDLFEISEPENAAVGLWEVDEWTGIRVESFVNFLSLPGEKEGDRERDGGRGEGGVVLEVGDGTGEMDGAREVGGQGRVDGEGGVQLTPEAQAVMSNAVRDSYPDAVDVEVSVTEDGMNIGVFGPAAMIDEAGSRGFIDVIVAILTAAIREGV